MLQMTTRTKLQSALTGTRAHGFQEPTFHPMTTMGGSKTRAKFLRPFTKAASELNMLETNAPAYSSIPGNRNHGF